MRTVSTAEDGGQGADGSVRDGGHTYLRCGTCNAVLMDFWCTRPGVGVPMRVRCSCPWCAEKGVQSSSYIMDLPLGMYVAGGFGRLRPDSEEDDTASTIKEDEFDILTDSKGEPYFMFQVKKAGKDARPYYSV